MIRRFKKDTADQVKDEFKTREIFTIESNASIYEEDVFAFISSISFKTIDLNKRKESELFKTTLIKSLLYSPMACIESIKNRINKISDLSDDYTDDINTLKQLLEKLQAVDKDSFSKYQELVNLIKNKMKWEKATNDRIVIFTERIITLKFLEEHLKNDLSLKDDEIIPMTGSTMTDTKINEIVEKFGQENSKYRLLIATDVASEGINLHYLSHSLIHFDIPWSLMVFQQRNGRIDRYGQEKIPRIYYMQTSSNDKKFKGDNRVLEVLVEKDKQATLNIGDPNVFMNVYDVKAEELMVALQTIEDVINDIKLKDSAKKKKLAKAKQLKDLIAGMSKPNEDKYPKEFEDKKTLLAIYDNLSDILGNLEVVDFELIVKNLTLKFDEIYIGASKKPKSHKNKDVENEITSVMEDALWDIDNEYNISIENKEKIYQTIRGIRISFYASKLIYKEKTK